MITSFHFLPHGMQVIPRLDTSNSPGFPHLDLAMQKVEIEADTIILITPHGLASTDHYLLYNHSIFQGLYFEINPEESVVSGEYKFRKVWSGDLELTKEIGNLLVDDVKLEYLTQGGEDYPLTLAWGETVPLFYIPENVNIVILSIPRKRYDGIEKMQHELIRIGSKLQNFAANHSKKISIVISGDLAHTHDPKGPYGFHESAKPFDEEIQQWVKDPTEEKLNDIIKLNETALACGMAGICILQGCFKDITQNLVLSEYGLPTYFGMIVTSWK